MFQSFFKRIVVLVTFLATGSLMAQAQSFSLNDPIPFNSKVVKGKLDNGLTYYVQSNPKPKNKVELRLVLNAGSILETDAQQGLAHFMEHMNFNGLKSFPKNELVHYLQSIGVKFGADLNANTGFDRTYYILPIPTDNPDNLKKGFKILSEWAQGALITNEEVEDERHVVYEEYRLNMQSSSTRMMRQYLPAMLNNSRYASRLPIGKEEVILKGSPEEVRKYYKDWYRPNLMAVIVVGDITTDKAQSMVKQYFGGLTNPKNEKERVVYEVDPYSAPKAMIVTDHEATNYSFSLMFPAQKQTPEVTWKDYRDNMVKRIFVQTLNRKFSEMTQKAQPPFTAAFASTSGTLGSFTQNNESFSLYTTPLNDIKMSIDSAISEILYVQKYGFTEKDIEITKNNVLAAYESSFNERDKMKSEDLVDEFARNFMDNEAVPGIENEYNFAKEVLPGISTKEVSKLAEEILSNNKNFFALVTGPSKGDLDLPNNEQLLTMVENAFKQDVKERSEKEAQTSLLSKEPMPGTIVSVKKDKGLGTKTYTLSNGVKVTVKPTNFKDDEILFSGVKFGGQGQFKPEDKVNYTFMSTLVETMGYGNFTPTELNNFLSGKNISLTPAMGMASNVMNGSSSVKDLKTLLELNYLQLTEPRLDKNLFDGFVSKMSTQLKFLKANPQVAFADSLSKVMYNNNPNAPLSVPTEKDLEQLNPERVLEIYKEQFSNADGFHFFIVGNVNEDTLIPLMEKYIASLPVKHTEPMYKDNGLRMVDGTKEFRFFKGSDQKSLVLVFFHGDVKYSQDLALKANMLGQTLTMEILDTIREARAYIYSGGANASLNSAPYPNYTLSIQMPCGPENVNNILKELNKEFSEFKTTGGPASYLEKAKKATLESHKERVKTNSYWLNNLQEIMVWGANKDFILNYDKKVNKLTQKDLINTANLLLGNNRFTALSFPEMTPEVPVEGVKSDK